jgi:NADPH-dependent glutamate synthase beta subunit-like oxidoreductase
MKRERAFGPHIMKSYTYRELPIGAVSIGIHDDVVKTGTWRSLRPVINVKTAPCNEACPAGVDVRAFISLMKNGLLEEACRLYLEENPFPGICGRVCNHPCEAACHRGHFDQAVEINALERFLADMDVSIRPLKVCSGKRVAVVGSGPSGISCAYYLARLGHKVTIFEALEVIGGLLRIGIPQYRLPLEAVEKEVLRIKALGVNFKLGIPISTENREVLETFDALALAFGASKGVHPHFDLSSLSCRCALFALDFLKSVRLGDEISLGKRVIIVGGGNTAFDAARVALRLGALPTILYRRTRSELPAFETEIQEALDEGVQILFLTSPLGVVEQGEGLQVKCIRNRMGGLDKSGRPTPVPIEGSEFRLETDTLITAVGERADLSFLPKKIQVSSSHTIVADEWGLTGKPGVFACGDVVDQPRTVAHAIGSGKKVAIAIDLHLNGMPTDGLRNDLMIGKKGSLSFRHYLKTMPWESRKMVRFEDLNPHYLHRGKSHKRPKLAKDERKGFAEISGNLTKDEAIEEAQRCINCGMCDLCGNCALLCPDGSVALEEGSFEKEIDYETCKGCGICANECPTGVIEMEKDE